MTKKVLLFAVAIAVTLSAALSGCGTAGSTETTAAGTTAVAAAGTTAAAESTAATLEPYEAVWYSVADRAPAESSMVMDEIAKVLKDTNTTLKYNVIPWGEYPDKMSMIIASNEPFDYAFMAPWTNYYQHVANGAFMDLTEAYDTKLPKLKGIMIPALINGAKVKGNIYGLPTVKEVAGSYGFDIDKDYAKEVGLDVSTIKTFADLEPYLKLAKEKLPGVTPFFERNEAQLPMNVWYDILIDNRVPAAIKLDDGNIKVVNQFETSEQMDNWKLVNKWYKAGYINKNPATTKEENIIASGKMFARSGGGGPAPEWLGPANRIISRAYLGYSITTSSTANAMVCVSKSTKNMDRALLFFDEISTNVKAHNLLCSGIEGKHYQVIDDTTTPKTIDYMPGQNGQNTGYLSGGAWTLGGDWFSSYLYKSDSKNRNKEVEDFNSKAVVSPALGFSVDTEPIKTEIAACQNVYAEIGNGLGTGMLDPEVYGPKFLAKLKAAGSDKIVAEVQKQVDEWRKSNGK